VKRKPPEDRDDVDSHVAMDRSNDGLAPRQLIHYFYFKDT
jgi:hypothetical protein